MSKAYDILTAASQPEKVKEPSALIRGILAAVALTVIIIAAGIVLYAGIS